MEKGMFLTIIICQCVMISVVFGHGIVEPGSCIIRTRVLKNGDIFEPQACFFCVCRNGTLGSYDLDPKDCPELPCEAAVQISVPGRCCKICPGTLARCWFNGMTVEDGDTFNLHPCGSCVCHNSRLTCDKKCPNELQLASALEQLSLSHSSKQ